MASVPTLLDMPPILKQTWEACQFLGIFSVGENVVWTSTTAQSLQALSKGANGL
jgi:hypothetical protein